MRKISVTLSILLVSIHLLNAQELSADIAFEERVYNFGTIKEANGKVSHTFVFQNKGKTPVTVSEVNTGCGCIGKVVTAGPIKPGGKGKVTITFDPGYKSGFFSKEIVVFSNNNKQYNRIWVEGVIEPMEHPVENDYPYSFGSGLFLRLKVLALGYLKPGETREMDLHYANSTDKEMTLRFEPNSNIGGLKIASPGKLKPKERGIIRVSFTMPPTNSTEMLLRLFVYVNNSRLKETLDIRVLNENKRNQK